MIAVIVLVQKFVSCEADLNLCIINQEFDETVSAVFLAVRTNFSSCEKTLTH